MKPEDPIDWCAFAFIAVCIALWLTGCGSTMRLEYGQPDRGTAAVELKLPEKRGYQK